MVIPLNGTKSVSVYILHQKCAASDKQCGGQDNHFFTDHFSACARPPSSLSLCDISTDCQSIVSRAKKISATMVLCLSGAVSQSASFSVPDYDIGQTSRVEIVTPFRLVVIDPEGTARLRQQEENRVAVIFRFNPNAADDAEAALKAALGNHRRKFLDAVEAVFNQRQIAGERLDNPRFQQVMRVYQRQNRGFPVLTNLARLWASGETDIEIQLDWTAKLRAMQSNYIRADNLPAIAKPGPVRVFSVKPPNLPVDLAMALQQGTNTSRSNLLTLSRARKAIETAFPPEAMATGKFLAGFLRANCHFEEKLTLEHRAQRTGTIFAADTYEPGQSLVTSGAVVTAKVKAALTEFRLRALPHSIQAELETERARAEAALAQLNARPLGATLAGPTRNENIYKWSLFSVLGLMGLWFVSRLLRSPAQPSTALVPNDASSLALSSASPTIACPSCASSISIAVTEPGAAPPAAQLRAAMVPHFAKWLANKMFRRLMWHRVYLIESQRQAEAELRELENRLIQMQVPLKERMQAYENRVAELEKQLTTAREEGRQLIRAQIATLQKKLDAERARQTDYN
jgi:hypothetical protein